MMFKQIAVVFFALALSACVATAKEDGKSLNKQAESKKDATAVSANVASAPPNVPVYRPPERGKPRARVGGGVRGSDRMWPSVFTLVPDHVGQTIARQPSLFWYLDELLDPNVEIVFTLNDEAAIDPLIETRLAPPKRAGIQRIDLTAFNAGLEVGHEYEWSVTLVVNPEQRTQDIITAGWIDRVEPPSGLASASGAPSAQTYAAHGLWYDALETAADGARAAPGDPEARRARDALLLQVGLGAAVPGS